jgi:dTDP-4-amino-4,6-dideoxygalactose transaminase
MSNVVAGIGRGQLKVLDQRVAKKRYIYEFYKRELGGLDGVEFMPINGWNEPNFWLSCMTLSGKVKPLDIMVALEEENIESRPIWKPMHLQPLYEKFDFVSCFEDDARELVAASSEDGVGKDYGEIASVSADIFNRGVCLPSDTKMTDDDLTRVCNIIKGLWV